MSFKIVTAASLLVFASFNLQAETSKQASNIIAVKEISSVSVDKSYRHLKISSNAQRYIVAFEKPCLALRHKDISNDNQTSGQLSAGSQMNVGTEECRIKSIQRDLDFPVASTSSHPDDVRQMLARPAATRPAL